MKSNLRHAISIGRTPTYFSDIKLAIQFAKDKAEETGKVQGVHRNPSKKNPFMVRRGFHQGGHAHANLYVAHPQRPTWNAVGQEYLRV